MSVRMKSYSRPRRHKKLTRSEGGRHQSLEPSQSRYNQDTIFTVIIPQPKYNPHNPSRPEHNPHNPSRPEHNPHNPSRPEHNPHNPYNKSSQLQSNQDQEEGNNSWQPHNEDTSPRYNSSTQNHTTKTQFPQP
nr:putative uncharacterized protein DDB_G0291608 [Penaeus vannamei]